MYLAHCLKPTGLFQSKLKLFLRNLGTTSFFVRPIDKKDIPQIIELRRSNNFYDAVSCYSMYPKLDPNTFIIVDDGNGNVAGLISLFHNNNELCTAGFRTIHPDYRNLRISTLKIYPQMLELANNKAIIAPAEVHLNDWTLKKFPYFEQNHCLVEYETVSPIKPNNLTSIIPENVIIDEYQSNYLQLIQEYDLSVVGYDRSKLIALHFDDNMSKTYAAFLNSKCVGYGTVKLNIQGGVKLGPLYADTPLIAEVLLKQLLINFGHGTGFSAACFSTNSSALRIFETLGDIKRNFVFLYYNKLVKMPENKNIYGLLDCEFEPF